MEVAALFFDDFLHHVGSRSAWHIFIHEQDAVCFLERLNDHAVNIKWQKRLHVDHFDLDANFAEFVGGFQNDSASMRRR